ncbi:FtsX-like permease family protein [Flammeovirga pectinis]|uniref:FtsX-like permease family protein n=1 Tax=Flammeovirga pectinis TaxID=2494373 RepID=A0A3Q9FNB5_9BACT|nr:ABC transporter permease [Flammeovirga pectinis]AZQ61055.1 FtsX-like permease family protein [Flammeovirga pectinis]
MLRNYIIIGIRNLKKHGLYSLVNVLGMSMGIAFFTLLFLIVKNELSYDDFHVDPKRTYRVVEVIDSQDIGERSASVPIPLGPTIKDLYPNYIERSVRFFNDQAYSHMLFANGKQYNEKNLYFTDSDFFKVFDFPLILGNKRTALSEPQSIVITTKIAQKYFGNENPLGKKVLYENKYYLTVTGVIDKTNLPTHLNFDQLISFSTLSITNKDILQNNLWVWNPCWTYILLKEGVKPEELEADFEILFQDGSKFPEFIRDYVQLYLQPIREIHLYSDLDFEMSPNGDYMYIYIFSAIALMVLIIAAINFMNLSAVRYSTRIREVGIRKAIGADQSELIVQFLIEAGILSICSMFGALIFMELLFPYIYQILGDEKLLFRDLENQSLMFFVGGSGVFVGALASFYPMYYLSGVRPLEGLNVTRTMGSKQKRFRKWSVIVQFVIAIFLLFSTYVSKEQLNLMKKTYLGFDTENIVIIPLGEVKYSPFKFDQLKEQFLEVDGVESVTGIDEVLGVWVQNYPFSINKGEVRTSSTFYSALKVRDDFESVFNLKLVAGHHFSEENKASIHEILVNEAMVKHLGIDNPKDAIGLGIYSEKGKEQIIGVLKDFHYEPIHKEIGPFIIDVNNWESARSYLTKYMAIRLRGDKSWEQVKPFMVAKWTKIIPYRLMDSFFLQTKVEASYKKEERLAKVSLIFSIIGVIIANLGLFGLASFITVQKNKEIAIRKALGMENLEAMLFISKEFFILIGSACLIAWPISYLGMRLWLENFPKTITIGIGVYIFSGGVTLLLTLITVSYHVVKAAFKNPVEDLKANR